MEDTISKLKSVAAILNHLHGDTDQVKYEDHTLLILVEKMIECIEELENMNM